VSKRRTLSQTAGDYIAALQTICDDPRTHNTGKKFLVRMIRYLQRVRRTGYIADEILHEHGLKVRSNSGPKVKINEDLELLFWARRLYDPKNPDRSKRVSWNKAHEQIADEIHQSRFTVRNRCKNAQHFLDSVIRPSAVEPAAKSR
jgi:hypothetical protein